MYKLLSICALMIAASPVVSASAGTVVGPNVGYYFANEYLVSTTCSDKKGVPGPAESPAIVYWPGAAAAGFRQTGTSKDALVLKLDTYPATPAVGVTSWSGQRVHHNAPANTSSTQNFSATITYVSSSAFLIALSHDESCSDGKTGTLVSNIALNAL